MYKLIGKDFIERLSDKAVIPKINGNIDYEEYKVWIAEGNEPEPEFTEEEIEKQRISSIKSKAGELINSKYPDYKQLNIIRTGGANLTEMTDYIDGIRTISNEAESNGTKVEDIIWE